MKTAGIAGGGLILSSGLLRAQKNTGGKTINLALVGIGAQGERLLDSLLKIPNLNFAAVCDIWKPRCTYGFRRVFREMKQKPEQYEDYKDVIKNHAKELDAVIIATPDFWHSPMTCDFLEAGVNVYCEKMMSDTIEGAKKMVLAARKSGKLLQIGHQRNSNPRYLYARNRLLRDVQICGKITACNGQWNRAVTKDLTWPKNQEIPSETLQKYGYKDMTQFRNWRWFKGFGGGAISDLGAHQIDIFAWFLGARPKSVMASGSRAYFKKDWAENVMCIFDYENSFQDMPVQVFYQVLTTTSGTGGYWETFMGDNGTLQISESPKLTKLYKEHNAVPSFEESDWTPLVESGVLSGNPENQDPKNTGPSPDLKQFYFPSGIPGSDKPIHMPHLENFFGAVRGENGLNCDAEHAFEAEAMVFKARESAETGQKLFFEPSDFVVEG